MIILVADTSILIDLERGGLLDAAFSCGLTMVVPDLLYRRELEADNGAYLKRLGLGVVSLSAKEVAYAQEIRTLRRALSLPDCFALSCATRDRHLLVTGDKNLRGEAAKRLGDVKGLLWILDQMETSRKIDVKRLADGLVQIAQHPRCRIPSQEIKVRLDRWNPGV
jgi:hypothetical protein